jgi:hypothetical protein
MPFPGTDFPASSREIVVDGDGKVTSYFVYRGNVTDGFLCRLYVNGVFIGEYNSKANARTAGNLAGA